MKRLALALIVFAALVSLDCVAYKATRTMTTANSEAPAPKQATIPEIAGSSSPSGTTQLTATSTTEGRVGPFRGKTSEATVAQTGSAQTFSGEIMDSACAAMGTHDAMMKQEGTKDAKECTLVCVDHGSKFVLYQAATKTVYQLSDQSKAKDYAGQKVKVTGTIDSTTKTINVERIDPA
jgi:hypothetical protein